MDPGDEDQPPAPTAIAVLVPIEELVLAVRLLERMARDFMRPEDQATLRRLRGIAGLS